MNQERTLLGRTEIEAIGIASASAADFKESCTQGLFIGIDSRVAGEVTLRALGDLEEFAISGLLDALVVAAGLDIGVDFNGRGRGI